MAEHNGVSTVRIDRLDSLDDRVLRAYHTVLVESAGAGRSNPSLWSFEGLKGYIQNLEHPESAHYYGAYLGDQLVGVASVDISEGDEGKTQVDLNIEVLPAYRRQGVATALYRFIEQKHLKSPYLVCGEIYPPFGQQNTWPGACFVHAIGAQIVHGEDQMLLTAERFHTYLNQNMDVALPAGYRLVSWADATPEVYRTQFAELRTRMEIEVPSGDSAQATHNYSVEDIVAADERALAEGRRKWASAAIAPDGRLAGYTLMYRLQGSDTVEQDDTYVLGDYRGNGLGLALKIANHRQLERNGTDFTGLVSWVDSNNLAMRAINQQLGYESLELCQIVEKQG